MTRCRQEDHALCLPTRVGVYSAVMIRSRRKVRSEHLHKVTQRFQFSSVSSRWQRRQHKTTLFTVPMLGSEHHGVPPDPVPLLCSLFPPSLSPRADHATTPQQRVIWCPVDSHLWVHLARLQTKHWACEQPPLHLNSPAPLLSSLIFGWKLWAHCQAYGSSPFQFIKLYRGIENPP